MATDITAITDSVNKAAAPAPRQFQGTFDIIPFTCALLDTTIAADIASQADIAVPGAELGDFVLIAIAFDTTGLLIQGAVRAAGVVEITVFNTEGTDANTTLVAARACNGIVLKPKANVFDSVL